MGGVNNVCQFHKNNFFWNLQIIYFSHNDELPLHPRGNNYRLVANLMYHNSITDIYEEKTDKKICKK